MSTIKRKGLSIKPNLQGFEAVLYDTTIVSRVGNKLTLNHGGFKTKHTKTCINDLVNNLGFHVYQAKGVWFIEDASKESRIWEDESIVIDLGAWFQ